MLNQYYKLNEFYSLFYDEKRVLLHAPQNQFQEDGIAETSFESKIHPAYAIILSFFTGAKNLKATLKDISTHMDINETEILQAIKPLLENNERVWIEYDNSLFAFPKNTLLKNPNKSKRDIIDLKKYNFNDIDIFSKRNFIGPTEIQMLINTNCVTDCIYCYVDNRKKNNGIFPISRLKELIYEAKSLGVSNFDISGTELFLYKYWYEFLETLSSVGYKPYLSTKIPLREEDIIKLKHLGFERFQFSIDSIDSSKIIKINRILNSNYIHKIRESISKFTKHGFKLRVNIVLTKYNDSIEEIVNVLNFLKGFPSVYEISLNPAGRSIYKGESEFNNFKISLESYNKLENYFNNQKNIEDYHFNIIVSGLNTRERYVQDIELKKSEFEGRIYCSANLSKIHILPDGNVSICDQLYWNENFIIGNVLEESIKSVWNSRKAKDLNDLKRIDFSNQSPCKTCSEFEKCRNGLGVCYSEVLQAYGENNWDFPDPACPNAPKPIYSLYHE
ncbi:radical SAM protein [Mariniflexile aquimaris]|uniref:Radical SAM protein n=1 Tax=Mariniflexile aquimaris TaxID=881009 RepID=A0ABW3BRD1_9FLAO